MGRDDDDQTARRRQVLQQVDDAQQREDHVQAIKCLRAALAEDDSFAYFWVRLGYALLDANSFDDALKACQKAISIDSDSAPAYTGMGRALEGLGRLDAAEDAFKRSVELAPTASRYVFLGDAQRSQNKLEDAMKSFRTALKVDPCHGEAMCNIALLCRDTHPDEAYEMLTKVVELDPQCAAAYREMGFILAKRGDSQSAEVMLQEALRIDDSSEWTHFYYGAVLLDLSRTKEAEEHYRKGVELAHSAAYAQELLGGFYRTQGRLTEAIGCLRKACDLESENATVAFKLGRCLLELGEQEEGRQWLQRSLAMKPDGEYSAEITKILSENTV
jgi:tetratricopeptide (TPR) repeat protein